jgi:hypothetical protein
MTLVAQPEIGKKIRLRIPAETQGLLLAGKAEEDLPRPCLHVRAWETLALESCRRQGGEPLEPSRQIFLHSVQRLEHLLLGKTLDPRSAEAVSAEESCVGRYQNTVYFQELRDDARMLGTCPTEAHEHVVGGTISRPQRDTPDRRRHLLVGDLEKSPQ